MSEDAQPATGASPRVPQRIRLGLGAAVVVALVAVSVTVGAGLLLHAPPASESIPASARPTAGGSEIAQGSVYVHVLGQVARPGLYVLDAGARVAEALAAAGGTLPDADLGAVNLARPLTDGEQVLVPAVGTAPGAGGAAGAPGAAGAAGQVGAGAAGGGSGALIDLNTADASVLDTLPRIGPALAQRIIDWRTANGRFTSVDDLLGVPGIGDKLLAGIRDRVRV